MYSPLHSVETWLDCIASYIVVLIEAFAIGMITVGVIGATAGIARGLWTGAPSRALREVWLRQARSMVAALSLQLAADVVATTVAPSWDEISRLAAVALVRAFLSFTLDHDIRTVRARQRSSEPPPERHASHSE